METSEDLFQQNPSKALDLARLYEMPTPNQQQQQFQHNAFMAQRSVPYDPFGMNSFVQPPQTFPAGNNINNFNMNVKTEPLRAAPPPPPAAKPAPSSLSIPAPQAIMGHSTPEANDDPFDFFGLGTKQASNATDLNSENNSNYNEEKQTEPSVSVAESKESEVSADKSGDNVQDGKQELQIDEKDGSVKPTSAPQNGRKYKLRPDFVKYLRILLCIFK